MDKEDLENYQLQLSQVQTALAAEPDNAELASLRDELQQLIDLCLSVLPSSSTSNSTKRAAETGTKQWEAGDEVQAKYSGDGNWYPARITSVGGASENRVYSIVFRGYNSTELVKGSELKAPSSSSTSFTPGSSGKRSLTKKEEEERDKKKKKNEKKLEVRAAKAKEQVAKQATWKKFASKSEKKGVHIAGVAGTSIFKTPDNPLGRGAPFLCLPPFGIC